jgi:hypothetical protein
MTIDSSYIGYLGFLGIEIFKSLLMYSNGTICLIKLLFKMGLFTVWKVQKQCLAKRILVLLIAVELLLLTVGV